MPNKCRYSDYYFYNCAPPNLVRNFLLTTLPSIFFWGVKFFYPLELIQATIRPGFFFFSNFVMQPHWQYPQAELAKFGYKTKRKVGGKKKEKKRILLYFSDGWTLLLPNIKNFRKNNFWESSNFGAFSLLLFLAQFFWFMSWTGIFFVTNWQNSQKRN